LLKPITLKANSLLSTAEPVQCISGSGSADLSDVLRVDSSNSNGCVANDGSAMLVSDSFRSQLMTTAGMELRAATVSLTTAAARADPDPPDTLSENAHNHLDSLLRGLPSDLTGEQRDRAEAFIRSRASVFSRCEYDIGCTSIIPHRIDTGEHAPHFEQLRRHPQAQLPVIDEHVQNMLEHDVIEPAASPWCSNVVMVHKQDGTMRLCIDYRKLNALTTKDKFLLPKIDSCLDTLNGCEFFSSCNLRWGYWQTEVDDHDHDKTAFVTRKKQWRFKVLSFGLANAPSQFTKILELVMSGLTYDVCVVYLDEILVFSKTFDEHLDRLATVFDRLDHYLLKLKPSKCSLF